MKKLGWQVDTLASGAAFLPVVAKLGAAAVEGLYAMGIIPTIHYEDSAPPPVRSGSASTG
jgi:hypothetical protein